MKLSSQLNCFIVSIQNQDPNLYTAITENCPRNRFWESIRSFIGIWGLPSVSHTCSGLVILSMGWSVCRNIPHFLNDGVPPRQWRLGTTSSARDPIGDNVMKNEEFN